jgi:Mg-chelatase subunit ChlD
MNPNIAAILLTISVMIASVSGQSNASVRVTPAESEAVIYGLVIDNSGTYRRVIDRVIRFASRIVDQNKPGDQAFLVTFVSSEKIVLRQEATDNTDELLNAVENMYIEGGQTAILDALKYSAEYLAGGSGEEPVRAKTLILITDGEDRKSSATIQDVVRLLKDGNIRLLVIGIAEQKVNLKFIDRLVKETGGKRFLPLTGEDLDVVGRQIADELRPN